MATNEEGFLDYEGLRRFYHRLKTIIDTGGNLTYPSDAVYILNPKNCTADSIKAVGGVIDGSGYGYHGQAYGDVSVSAGGKGFDFGGTNGYIRVSDNIAGILSTNIECLTLTARFKTTASNCFIGSVKRGASAAIQLNVSSGKGRCGGRTKNADAFKGVSTTANVDDGKWHTLTAILDYLHGTMKLYLDEALSATSSLVSAGEFEAVDCCYISNDSSFFRGSISDFRIYNRALGENEIKSLYIIPQEALPTRVTGDLIAKDEPVITDLAQLKDDVVESIVHKSDLKYPTGAILNLNPKNCTTESIKTANGVIDGSGFGYHGQANANVEIINDNEFGQCFNFSSGGNITLPASAINAAFNGLDGITFIIGIKNWNSNNSNATVLEFINSGYTANIIQITSSGYINIGGRRAVGDDYESHMTESTIDHNYHQICGQFDYQNAKVYIYVDGEKVLDSSYQTSGKFTFGVSQAMLVRGSNYTGVISEFKIYPRILSNVEIKSLKMILQEAIMQRVTADLIGANAVKAIHLDAGSVTANAVGTNQIITDSANIANAIVTNAKISTIESEKINANNLQAGAVTASKLSVTGYPYAKSCSCLLNPQGVTNTSNGSYIPDSSGHGKYGQMYNIAKINNLTNSNFMRGEALVFNGTSSYIQTVADIKPSSTNALSFYFKIRPTGNSHDYQFIFDTAGGGNRIGFGYTKALKWYMSTSTGDHISSTGPVLNSDYTVCITLTGEVCVAYVNNVQVLSFSCSYRTITTALVIGSRNNILANTYGFQGYMSEFGIFEENWNSDTRALLQIYGAGTESGQITPDRLSPDAVTSRNYNSTTVASYFSTAGFSYNLADGSLKGKFLSFNETNGYYAGTTVSRCDREIKSKISEISTLNKLKQLDIYSWKYDRDKIAIKEGNKPEGIGTTESPMNIAPMAQDFNKLFGVCYNGEDYIDHLDMIGVALASIKELAQQLDDAVVEIRRLKRILKSQNIITDEIISADKDSEAIRRLEIEQKRQLKREQKIREKVLENEEIDNSENTYENGSESSEEADKSV